MRVLDIRRSWKYVTLLKAISIIFYLICIVAVIDKAFIVFIISMLFAILIEFITGTAKKKVMSNIKIFCIENDLKYHKIKKRKFKGLRGNSNLIDLMSTKGKQNFLEKLIVITESEVEE